MQEGEIDLKLNGKMMPRDWDTAYNNMSHVAGSAALPAHWAAEAAAYRAECSTIEEDIAYGTGARQKLDIVWPEGRPKGLAVFVHGGNWMRLYKSDWTQFAEGARANGWAVAVPGYTLAPTARISEITLEIRDAIDCAAQLVSGPIHLSGHSAGGHLVSRMVCSDIALDCADRIEHVLSISGLHDLRPLMRTQMNDTLRLDLAEARSESPALLDPKEGIRLTAWAGGGERPEFLRQANLLKTVWQSFDVEVAAFSDGIHHHFSVIEGLKDPFSEIVSRFVNP